MPVNKCKVCYSMKKAENIASEEFVKRSVIQFLSSKGWGRNLKYGGLRDRGVDIQVCHNKYNRYFLIEVKGGSTNPSGFEVAFIYSLGQIITRMNVGKARYYYGLALPEKAAKIALRRIPYQIAIKLVLHVFSVKDNGKVNWYKPVDIKKYQQRKENE